MRAAVFALAVASLSAATPAAAARIYAPGPEYETRLGASGRLIASSTADTHVQMFFDPAIFGGGALWIDSVTFRWDVPFADSFPGDSLRFGKTLKLQLGALNGAPSATFADNLDGAVTVLSGARRIHYGLDEALQNRPDLTFVFDQSFRYDPGQGRLALDLFIPAYAYVYADAVNVSGARTWLYAQGSGATGALGGYTPVARFDVRSAAPEPASWALLIMGFGGAGAMLRRRRVAA